MKLLVVEDEAAAVAFLSRGLSEEGYAVDVATDAAAAMRFGAGWRTRLDMFVFGRGPRVCSRSRSMRRR